MPARPAAAKPARLTCTEIKSDPRFEQSDTDLAAAVTPSYPFAGKRSVVSSDFFPALLKPNVTLVPSAVTSCTRQGLVDAGGHEHQADAVVLCTGFEVTEYLSTVEVVGREGCSLSQAWKGEPQAFLGIMTPGFPNFWRRRACSGSRSPREPHPVRGC